MPWAPESQFDSVWAAATVSAFQASAFQEDAFQISAGGGWTGGTAVDNDWVEL